MGCLSAGSSLGFVAGAGGSVIRTHGDNIDEDMTDLGIY